MTHRGPFKSLLFCDSVVPMPQGQVPKHRPGQPAPPGYQLRGEDPSPRVGRTGLPTCRATRRSGSSLGRRCKQECASSDGDSTCTTAQNHSWPGTPHRNAR